MVRQQTLEQKAGVKDYQLSMSTAGTVFTHFGLMCTLSCCSRKLNETSLVICS